MDVSRPANVDGRLLARSACRRLDDLSLVDRIVSCGPVYSGWQAGIPRSRLRFTMAFISHPKSSTVVDPSVHITVFEPNTAVETKVT
jgi:hypothetical protein